MEMEVDTGAVVSVMNFEVYERHFRDIKMKPVRRKLYAYSGTPLPVEGQITVQVKCNGQTETLPIVVVQADKYAPPLFGRDWLSVIRLDWPQLFATGQYSINVDLVEDLKERYHDVFQPGLGPVFTRSESNTTCQGRRCSQLSQITSSTFLATYSC